MDELKSETKSLKHCLIGVKMHACRVKGGSFRTYTIVDTLYRQYLQLKLNKDYTRDVVVEECEFSVTITKKKRCISVVLIIKTGLTSRQKLMLAYVGYGGEDMSEPVYPEQIYKDEYQLDFDLSVINVTENQPLKRGELRLLFQFEFFAKEERILPYTDLKMNYDSTSKPQKEKGSDEAVLLENLKKAFREPKFGDYVILLEPDMQFHVHKSVLVARSEFLAKCVSLKENGLKIPGTTPQAVDLLLEYLYCGKIKVTRLGDLIGVLALSVRMQMGSLHSLCIRNLEDKICMLTANKTLKEVENITLESLVKAVKDYKGMKNNACEIFIVDTKQNALTHISDQKE